ncbi:hypothetical protein E4T56_gene18402 [Termitomyces sp. T112]|nr:hypothetical protein E4T56_gene18402 [Termitomyces sp. T112]
MPAPTPAIPATCPLPLGIPIDMDAARQLHTVPLLCQRCQKPGHFAQHCLLGSGAAKDAAGALLPDEPTPELTLEEISACVSPPELEEDCANRQKDLNVSLQMYKGQLQSPHQASQHLLGSASTALPGEQDKLNAFLQENLDSGHIHPSKSLMASPVFFIKKKDGLLQLVQNYWILNAMTVKNCYPLPLISELINNLWGVQYFTKLDVWWGYNNMHIQEGDKWKAAFQTNQSRFEPLVIFFRLTNSPATFQTMMNDIFWDLITESIDGQQEELVIQAAQVLKSGHTTGAKLVYVDEWALWDGILTFKACIYVPNIPELC